MPDTPRYILRKRTAIFFSVLALLIAVSSAAQLSKMPRSLPEAEGVSSKGILQFVEAANKSKHEFHSFMFLRHGKVIAEGWWDPYKPELRHSLYSISKSFTSTAVGFAVSEKKLAVTDKVISFFPEDLPDTVSQYLADLTVRDLLSMSAGQDPDPTFATVTRDSNWVRAFLATPVMHKPGSVFLYNTLATHMLSAIVQKVTGEKIIDYLGPRLFKPLGIEGMDWEISPQNINTGGWGLRVKTEDMAKLGQLYLQKGMWNNSRVLPAEWIEEATTSKIRQTPTGTGPQANVDSSDWLQGYGYQFWRCRNNAYRADGAFGQFIVVMPEQDAVVAITAETPDMQDELNLVWKYLLPACSAGPLTPNTESSASLKKKLAALALDPAEGRPSTSVNRRSGRKTYALEPNERRIDRISFEPAGPNYRITFRSDTAEYMLDFAPGKWASGETYRRGPYLLYAAKASYVGIMPLKVAASYGWKDDNTLELVLRYVESPHTETITCHFNQDKVVLDMQNSFDQGKAKQILKGSLVRQ